MTQRRHLEPLPLGGESGPPYSKGLMARALMAVGVPADRAYDLARRVEGDLADRRTGAVDLDRLHELAVDVLGEAVGGQAVRRLRRFQELQRLELPVIVLIGGGTGTGKSTVATEVAYRLGITRVASTDFVRQTMRAVFSEEFMPSIHHSSFEAWRALDEGEGDERSPVVAGFLEQTRNVLVGVRAAIDRVLQEGWSMVLEGVHLVPGLVPPSIDGALVVYCVLSIDDEAVHADHFWIRDATSERPVTKYLDALPDIRLIQDYVVDRARRHGVPVVENTNIDLAIGTVMELVLAGAERVVGVPR